MKKSYHPAGGSCRVTFELPGADSRRSVTLVGDFNDWDRERHPLKPRKDGRLSVTLSLRRGRYRFRYLIDGSEWENDPAADEYVPNDFGTEDSVVVV